jgi:nitrate reductase alpha subunit
LRARFPFFHEEQRLGFVEVGVEMGSHAPCGCPRGAK